MVLTTRSTCVPGLCMIGSQVTLARLAGMSLWQMASSAESAASSDPRWKLMTALSCLRRSPAFERVPLLAAKFVHARRNSPATRAIVGVVYRKDAHALPRIPWQTPQDLLHDLFQAGVHLFGLVGAEVAFKLNDVAFLACNSETNVLRLPYTFCTATVCIAGEHFLAFCLHQIAFCKWQMEIGRPNTATCDSHCVAFGID